MKQRACVYTSLFGSYEDLLEQPASEHSALDFICFTDDPELRSDTWQVRVVSRALPEDPQRSSRYPKICAHRFLHDYEMSMYIDNSVLLKQPPEFAFDAFLPNGQTMGVFAHSYRETVEDEFTAVMKLGYEHQHVCLQQLESYRTTHPDVLALKPTIGGVLIRRHSQSDVVRSMETWWRHVLNYSRRDQLSFLVAMKEARFNPAIATVDIRDNDYWRWPASTGRRRHDSIDDFWPMSPAQARV